jgi:hypothetical protein
MNEKKGDGSFWESMQKSAEPVRSLPGWTKAGINLSERNFTTYRGVSAQEPMVVVADHAGDEAE